MGKSAVGVMSGKRGIRFPHVSIFRRHGNIRLPDKLTHLK
jgi:hypothetical protein